MANYICMYVCKYKSNNKVVVYTNLEAGGCGLLTTFKLFSNVDFQMLQDYRTMRLYQVQGDDTLLNH